MKVKELLSDESKWTRKAYARDSHGVMIEPRSPSACCWCISGAIERCYQSYAKASEVSEKIKRHLPFGKTSIDFNDDPATTFADIRRVLELADV